LLSFYCLLHAFVGAVTGTILHRASWRQILLMWGILAAAAVSAVGVVAVLGWLGSSAPSSGSG
jgi:hypothetical protein